MKKNNQAPLSAQAKQAAKRVFHNGAYATAITVVVLAFAVLLGLIVDALPTKYTKYDLSQTGVLTLGETTNQILDELTQDVDAYYLVQEGQEDTLLAKLLDRYAETSSHFSWQKIDPTLNPNFAANHDAANASSGSIILSTAEKNYLISYDAIYPDYQAYYYGYADSYSFGGENAITTGIFKVTSGESSAAYYTSNHGEATLSSNLTSALSKQNIDLSELNLLSAGKIPSDCELLIISCPQTDFTGADSTNEISLVRNYLADGGKVMLLTDAQYATPNLDALMAEYGLARQEGVVLEGDSNYCLPDNYASSYLQLTGVMCALPTLETSDESASGIASALDTSTFYLAPLAQGITTLTEEMPGSVTAEGLLTTSNSAYSKLAGYDMTTVNKEDGDLSGPFDLAVWANDSASGAEIVWVGCGYFADETVDSIVGGGNSKLLLACAAEMTEQATGTLVDAKSLEGDSLTVSAGTAAVWTWFFLIVVPLALIIAAIVVSVHRRRR